MSARIASWLAGPLPSDARDSIDRLARADGVRHVAVMPDVHVASDVCVGVAVATADRLYPAAVGADIGCGVAALAFDVAADAMDDERSAARILQRLYERVPAVRHRSPRPLPPALDGPPGTAQLAHGLRHEAARQIGTLGSGNHFLELQRAEDDGRLWVMVHTGSRGLGPLVHAHHLRTAAVTGPGGLRSIPAEEAAGVAYRADLAWCLAFAEASRAALLDVVVDVLAEVAQAEPIASSRLSCHHNHVQRERHFGEDLWVHRKGAIAVPDGVPGIVPGSMGTLSVHVEGRGHADALLSSAHGAGRSLSRGEAARRISVGALTRQMEGVWFDHRLAARLRDEAPEAYKDVRAVLRAQEDLVRVTRRLRPVLVFKGS